MADSSGDESSRGADATNRAEMHVVLVHGTRLVGKRTRWSEPTGTLHSVVAQRCPNATIHVHEWGGANTFAARYRGAQSMAALLDNLPGRVAIIAHSHGGNVARSALALAAVRVRPRQLITLGTPFVVLRRRGTADDAYAGFLALAALVAASLLLVGNYTGFRLGVTNWLLWPIVIGPIGVGALFLWSRFRLWRLGLIPLSDSDRAIVAPEQVDADLIVLATASDEASLALTLGEVVGLVTGVANRVYTALAVLFVRVTIRLMQVAASVGVIYGVITIVQMLGREPAPGESRGDDLVSAVEQQTARARSWLADRGFEPVTDIDLAAALALVGVIFAGLVIVVTALILGLPPLFLILANALQYITTGFDSLALSRYVSVAMSPLASGEQRASLLTTHGTSLLRHSSLTTDEITVDAIAEHVAQFLGDDA